MLSDRIVKDDDRRCIATPSIKWRLRRPLPDTEIISQVAKIPRLTRNTEEWQIGTDRNGKNAAITTTHSENEYRKPLNDVPTAVLPSRIISSVVAKALADRTWYWKKIGKKDWETRLKNGRPSKIEHTTAMGLDQDSFEPVLEKMTAP